MMSKKLRSVIEPPSPLSTLKYRAVRETAAIAVGYHRLISEMRFGEAVDAYWDDAVVMRWADGRTFRGFGACSALIASLVHKVEMVQNVYDQPSVGAGTFVIGVVTRQRLLATGQLIEISRNWGHKVRKGKVVEIYEHFQSLLLFHEAGDPDGLSSDGPVNGQVPTRVLVPFDDAIAWLSTHGA